MKFPRSIAPLMPAVLVLLSPQLFAQQPLGPAVIEEIVVTAEFRETTVDNLAGSASVVSLADVGTVVNHLEEVLAQAPNVNFASGASRGRYIQIRGIGERGQFDEPLNSSVGLIVDGVDLSGVGAAATLFDVQQVEILRGPQGTLYGANALAGLINVVTPAPSDHFTSTVRLEAGDYGAFGAGAVISGPVGEGLGYRISAQRYRDDGFMENEFLGRDNTNNHDERTVRAKLMGQAGRADWKLSFGRVDVDNGYDAFSLDNDRHTRSDEPGFDRQETNYAALGLTWDVSDALILEGAVATSSSDIDYGYDEDWTFTGFNQEGYTSTDRYIRDRSNTTAEARLLSKPGAGIFNGEWDWVAGFFSLFQDVDLERQYTFAPLFFSEFEIRRLAAYGEISGPLSDRWRLTLGGRWERHEADYEDILGVDLSPDNNLLGGRVLLEYELSGNSFIYTGVTRGYNAGGFNTDGTIPADLLEYDEETLHNLEVGYKTKLLDNRLSLRTSLFYMWRDDIQIASSVTRPVTADPNGPVEFIQFRTNAAEGYNRGVELEVDWQVSDPLRLFANVGLLDAEYDPYINGDGIRQRAREQAHAPSYQFFLGGEYVLLDRLTLRLEAEGKDAFFFSDSHLEQSDRYELFNASLTYQGDNYRVRLWGRNITDEDYFVRGFGFGNDPRDLYTPRAFTQLGEPRQFGLSVSADF